MANFDIQYNFIAIDKFSAVAKKVQREAAKIAKTMGRSTKGLSTNSQTLMRVTKSVEKTSVGLNHLGNMTERVAKKTKLGMEKITTSVNKSGNALTRFTEKAAAWGDKMAFKGYMQFMNIGFPILLAGKLGMTYSDQVERANLQMTTLFGKQKNYGVLSKEITGQAQNLSKHSRFTSQEIEATSAHIGVMTNNLRLSRDLTPLALRYAAVQGVDPSQAADKLLQAIRVGGAVAGTGMVLPKGMGAAMAQTRYEMLQKQLGGQYAGVLAKDVGTTTAQLHKMSGQLQKLAGTIMIQAAPALTSMANAMAVMIKPLISFLDKYPGFAGRLAQGSLAALALVTGVTLIGAAVSAIMMPFEILIATFSTLKAATLGLIVAEKALTASETEAGVAAAAGGAGMARKAARLVPFVGAAAAAGVGIAALRGHAIHKQVTAMAQHERQLGRHPTTETLFTYGGPGIGAAIQMPVAPTHHKVNLDINVNHAGNVESTHATASPHVDVGVNMRHAHD